MAKPTRKHASPARRLAAIMFTDIVGYTALMGSDEDRAFEILRKNRKIHSKFIQHFKGQLIKEMGDGMLAQFDSAADSVRCAIQIQKQALKELEAKVRIGIHLGDITLENNDVFGDGVNIASRLQAIADPGGIFISESVHNALRNQKDINGEYLGEIELKNVHYPFKTYYLKGKGLPVPSNNRVNELTGVKKSESVVVLPFDNFTGSSELNYFVEGMHASLIGSISKISGLRVISKTTANAFKDTNKSITEIANELGVDTIIEASVLGLGDKISLQVKLLDAYPEEKQLWMQDYFEDKTQILNLYNMVTKEISDEINVLLTPEEERLLAKTRTVDRKAYEDYLKARSFINDGRKESMFKASDYLESAIETEPDWALLYAGLAELWMWIQQAGFENPSVAAPKIYQNLNKAMELDPDIAEVHYLKAMIAQLVEWDLEKSEKEFLKTLAINPNDPTSRLLYAQVLLILQRNLEAMAQMELAIGLDPLNPFAKLLHAGTLGQAGDFKGCLSIAEELVAVNPKDMNANFMIEFAGYMLGECEKVIRSLKYSLSTSIEEDVYKEIARIFSKGGIARAYEELMKHLEKHFDKNPSSPFDMAIRYIIADQPDKAMNWIEKALEIHDPQITYITASGHFLAPLFENPRFIAVCEKANLPITK